MVWIIDQSTFIGGTVPTTHTHQQSLNTHSDAPARDSVLEHGLELLCDLVADAVIYIGSSELA